MKDETMANLETAYEMCEEEDRSTEYMIAFMQGYAEVDHACVMNFLTTYKFTKVVQSVDPAGSPQV